MKLYISPGACSLSPHIALQEAGLPHQVVKIDLRQHKLPDGGDFYTVNDNGYVPVLELDLDCVGSLDEDVGHERRCPVLGGGGPRSVVHACQDQVRLRVFSQARVGRGERRLPVGRDRGAEGVELAVLAEQQYLHALYC